MVKIKGMETEQAQALWSGGTDAHGNLPERAVSDGKGNPCRHCLKMNGAPFKKRSIYWVFLKCYEYDELDLINPFQEIVAF